MIVKLKVYDASQMTGESPSFFAERIQAGEGFMEMSEIIGKGKTKEEAQEVWESKARAKGYKFEQTEIAGEISIGSRQKVSSRQFLHESKGIHEVLGYQLKNAHKDFIRKFVWDEIISGAKDVSGTAEVEGKGVVTLKVGRDVIAKIDHNKKKLFLGHPTGNTTQTWINAVKKIMRDERGNFYQIVD